MAEQSHRPVTAGSPGEATDDQVSRIGPNAITRIAEAMQRLHGAEAARQLFEAAAMPHYLDTPPGAMVDENEVIALHRAGRRHLGIDRFAVVARLAGELTGDYVMQYRIPRPARILLRLLPAPLAARMLARAIAAHAWTFTGSGGFSFQARHNGMLLNIRNSPLARGEQAGVPLCDYYAATFERIFRRLVKSSCEVAEIGCIATGSRACCFDVRFSGSAGRDDAG